MAVPYLRPVGIPRPLTTLPDPNVTWMFQIVRNWDYLQKADAGLVGVPFDGAVVTGRQGARYGPKAVRDAFYANATYSLELDVDLSSLNIVDCGDVEVNLMDAVETYERTEAVLTFIFKSGIIPLIIGGDHSLTSPCIKALCMLLKGKKVGIVDFDSHHDCRVGLKGPQSGVWLREILEIEGEPIRGENIAQIGIHGFRYSLVYRNYVRKNNIRVFTPKDVREKGMESVIEEALEVASNGTDAIYVSVDIDCLDIAFAPGCAACSPGGLTTSDLITGVIEVAKHPLTHAIDIMEIAPPLDVNDMTVKVGGEVLINFLCGLLLRKA